MLGVEKKPREILVKATECELTILSCELQGFLRDENGINSTAVKS